MRKINYLSSTRFYDKVCYISGWRVTTIFMSELQPINYKPTLNHFEKQNDRVKPTSWSPDSQREYKATDSRKMNQFSQTKIIFCITKSTFGGAGRYVLDLATSLPKETFDVAVAFGGRGLLKEKLELSKTRTISMESLDRDINFSNDVETFKRLLLIFRVEKPDIIHLNSSKMGGIGALAGRIRGIKNIVFTAHGWPFNENRSALSKAIIWIFSWITALLSTKVIVLDEYDKRQALRFPFCKNKIVKIYNGINSFELFNKESSRIILSDKIGKNPFENKICIGTIAELHNNKGLKYGIEAIGKLSKKELAKIIYVIIGEGEEREELTCLIHELGLKDKVFLVGYIDDAKKYLNVFDIFMLPSLKEGLPYVLMEAGLAGLPIISTNVGGIPDIFGANESKYLVNPQTPEELSGALSPLIEDKKARETLGKKNKENIKTNFTLDKMIQETMSVYKI